MYNYYDAMKNDIYNVLLDDFCYYLGEYTADNFDDLNAIAEKLNDDFWTNDAITGNASGSYTFNSYIARDYVTENDDLCREALEEFCTDAETIADRFLNSDWEYFDITIRCYILRQVIDEVLEEIKDELEDAQSLREAAEAAKLAA